jgi:hypothetical protein
MNQRQIPAGLSSKHQENKKINPEGKPFKNNIHTHFSPVKHRNSNTEIYSQPSPTLEIFPTLSNPNRASQEGTRDDAASRFAVCCRLCGAVCRFCSGLGGKYL